MPGPSLCITSSLFSVLFFCVFLSVFLCFRKKEKKKVVGLVGLLYARPGVSQTVTHKTGIPISALDISPQRTHAVIGGKEILKTIRVSPDHSSEEFNLRNAVISYSSTHYGASTQSARHKDQLAVRDVKWSLGNYDRIIATAVANGRILVYDVHRTGLEYCRFQGHSRQVHRLAFNPHFPAWLLSGSQDSSIRMWDLRAAPSERGSTTCSSKKLYNGNSDAIRDIRWSPSDGVMFATATDSGAVQLWDCRKTSAPVMRITAHDRSCFSVDWHPDGKHIITGGTDRQVKVWDFSSTAERRQKPTFQFRTPQAVLHARWRPPSWTSESSMAVGDWQSTQVVTSYDKEDPRLHLWDLQRPHIPFREFDRYDSHAADLLWHSKDLLWTVGDSGAFTQTDVRYAPQVVNRRPTGSVAWSPSGDVLAFVQKRPRRSPLGLTTSEFLGYPEEEGFNQSPSDDILDEPSFTSALRHRHTKSVGARPSKSLGSTPPGAAADFMPVASLEKALSNNKAPGSRQLGAMGRVSGATMDPMLLQYLTREYTPLMTGSDDKHLRPNRLRSLLESFDHNADCAEAASLFKLAQTWRILKYAVLQELQFRAREQRRSPEKANSSVNKKMSKEGLLGEKTRALEEGSRHDKMKNRLFKGVIEAEGSRTSLSDNETPSNLPTPLARPLPDSPTGSVSSVTSNDDLADIQPLPPSVLSSNQDTVDSSWSDMDPRSYGQFRHRESNSSEMISATSVISDQAQVSVPESPIDQRSAPRAITGRAADRRNQHEREYSKQDSEDYDYEQKMENERIATRDFREYPKKAFSLESPSDPKQPGFRRQESSDSFPMFSASTESSHPVKSAGASFSPTSGVYDIDEVAEHEESTVGEATDENETESHSDLPLEINSVQGGKTVRGDLSFEESLPETDQIHVERPSSPPPLVTESTPLKIPTHKDDETDYDDMEDFGSPIPGVTENLSGLTLPIRPNVTGSNPWSVEVLMREAIRHYHSNSTYVDVQSAAHLLHKLHVLFQDCDQILPYEESELIFKTCNEHLLRQSMYVEAAELRLLCVPSYPAVYDYAQMDTFVNVFCFKCKRPYENPRQDNSRCHRCDTPQDPCTICMSIDPPPEWVAEQSLAPIDHDELSSPRSSAATTEPLESPLGLQKTDSSFTTPRPKGTALWTWCQGCGHGGHMACINTWLSDISMSEGSCATPGCMHDCGPGPRREQNRAALQEESKRRDFAGRRAGMNFVRRDPWAKSESKAVEKVRGMLGATVPGSGSGSTGDSNAVATTSSSGVASSGMVSPKKVRLVTPNEQGKRRPGYARASTGGQEPLI